MKYSLIKENKSTGFDYIDQDGVSWESPAQWLFTGILGGCGCGRGDVIAEKAVKLLEYFATEHEKRDIKKNSPYSNLTLEVLAHWMDKEGLIEHGGSVGGSWLSEKGKEIYKVLCGFEASKEVER